MGEVCSLRDVVCGVIFFFGDRRFRRIACERWCTDVDIIYSGWVVS